MNPVESSLGTANKLQAAASSSNAPLQPQAPPPLPPRIVAAESTAPMNTFGQSSLFPGGLLGAYGSPYSNPYAGGFNTYGNGGMMGFGNVGYGGLQQMERMAPGGFASLAEESSRDTFRSIESVVNAVNAVATMLSSTHNAVYSSFRAVIGVVEQFGMLKTQVRHMVSALLGSLWLIRVLRGFWHRLLVRLRLKPANYAHIAELAWCDASLPLGPYLIYKSILSMVEDVRVKRQWAIGSGSHYTARTLFDFQGSSAQELSFMSGETLRIAPKELQPKVRGWLLASSNEGDRIGLVPINYIRIISRQTSSPPPDRSSTSLDNLCDGIGSGGSSSQTEAEKWKLPS